MSALDEQVGGDHYRKLKIQPYEYFHANNIPKVEGDIIQYVTRWRDKGGIEDLRKAAHCIELLIDLEEKTLNKEVNLEPDPVNSKIDPLDLIGEENNIHITDSAKALIERQCEDCGD